MLPYAYYCVLFDTRFAGDAAQFLHAVVLSRGSEKHTKISTYLFPRHAETPNVGRRRSQLLQSLHGREGYLGLFTAVDSCQVYRNITIIPFNWKRIHFIHMPITRS